MAAKNRNIIPTIERTLSAVSKTEPSICPNNEASVSSATMAAGMIQTVRFSQNSRFTSHT